MTVPERQRTALTPVASRRPRRALVQLAALATSGISLLAGGCTGCSSTGGGTTTSPTTSGTGRVSDARRKYPLDTLPTATVKIDGNSFRVWLADENDPQRPGIVNEGLMFVPSSEIADDQGMLFVFPDEEVRGFWMKNTIAPLDIAFARMNGTIVKIWQMPPLTLETFSSIEPAMFALEVKQGTFARLGIREGDPIEIPLDISGLKLR